MRIKKIYGCRDAQDRFAFLQVTLGDQAGGTLVLDPVESAAGTPTDCSLLELANDDYITLLTVGWDS